MRFSCILFSFLVIGNVAFAQQPLFTHYENLTVGDGLPQSYISNIVQDKDGFLWIGTLDGLARYDGRQFKVFRPIPGDTTSLSSNFIESLKLDSSNKLWIFYRTKAADVMDARSFIVKRHVSPIVSPDSLVDAFSDHREILSNLNGEYWMYQFPPQLYLYSAKDPRFAQLFKRNGVLKNQKLRGYMVDSSGKFWYVTINSIVQSDDSWKHFKSYSLPKNSLLHQKEGCLAPMLELSNDRIMIADLDRLIIFDKKTNSFNFIDLPGNYHALHPLRDKRMSLISGNLVFDYHNNIYELTEKDELINLWQYPVKGNFEINTFTIDRSGTLWVGTNADGLYRVDLAGPKFYSYTYHTSFQNDVFHDQMEVSEESLPPNWQKSSSAYSFRYSYSGNNNQLYFYDTSGSNNKIFLLTDRKLVTLNVPIEHNDYITGLSADAKNGLWALDSEGALYHWENQESKPLKYLVRYNADDDIIFTDLECDENFQWVAVANHGLYKIKDGKIIEHFTKGEKSGIPDNIITDLCGDPSLKNILWIGTLGGGIVAWNKISHRAEKNFTTNDGLSNNSVYSIIPVSDGSLWLSTNNGLSHFKISDSSFINYSTRDGLIENEFNRRHFFKTPDGRLAFGSTKGYTIFDPLKIKEDTFQTPVRLTGLFINGDEIIYTPRNKILSTPVSKLKTLILPYDQNYLAFTVAAMQYNAPQKNKFRYKLDGYDEDWIYSGTENSIRYNKLPPGKYTLKVNATNTIGKWSSLIRELGIQIKPPLWKTWWAYFIYAAMAILLIRLYWSVNKKRMTLRQEIEFKNKEAERLREMDEMKTRFFSNITHEFRTPLTLILSPLEKYINDPDLTEKGRQILESNHKNASQLLQLVNQLLDISKLEHGQMKINASVGQPAEFIDQCVSRFAEQAKQKNIALAFNENGVKGHYFFDKEKLEKIVFNLISNAIKFTEEGGKVTINVEISEITNPAQQDLKLTVEDTGIGIDKEKLQSIFDRFYQADDSSTRKHEGTGIGLALVKELTELLNGQLEVSSEKGKGSLFTVHIPVTKITEEAMSGTNGNSSNGLPDFGELVKSPINGNGHIILAVEDNNELRAFITESLCAKWETLSAKNGNEAWNIIISKLPEIVIADVMMPVMNGIELCRKAKSDPRTAHINFIMLTAKAAQKAKLEALEAGADEYLTKPFNVTELELRIANQIHRQENLRKQLQKSLFPNSSIKPGNSIRDIFLKNLYEKMEENLNNSELDVEMLCAFSNMSRSTLNRKIKALLNITPNDLIKQYRLQRSADLLTAGHSVTEVTYMVGFETPSYFTQCFKELYGQTPSEFQKLHV